MDIPIQFFEEPVLCRYCRKPIEEGLVSRFAGGAAYAHLKCSLEEDGADAFRADVVNIKYVSRDKK